MSSNVNFIEKHVGTIQYVLIIVIFLLATIVFGLAVSLDINTVVTEQDLLLGTVVSDADRSKIKAVTGLSLVMICAAALSTFLRYRFQN